MLEDEVLRRNPTGWTFIDRHFDKSIGGLIREKTQ